MDEDNSKVFVDSNFYIALFNPEDALYNKAVQISKTIQKQDLKIFISNLIFMEAITVLSMRTDRKTAVETGIRLLENPNFIHIDLPLEQKSWEIFKKIDRKNMSFVDCSILAVMQSEGIKKLLSFDEEDFSSLRKAYDFSYY